MDTSRNLPKWKRLGNIQALLESLGGGTADQVLSKASATDYDWAWADSLGSIDVSLAGQYDMLFYDGTDWTVDDTGQLQWQPNVGMVLEGSSATRMDVALRNTNATDGAHAFYQAQGDGSLLIQMGMWSQASTGLSFTSISRADLGQINTNLTSNLAIGTGGTGTFYLCAGNDIVATLSNAQKMTMRASTSGSAAFNLDPGAAVSSPVNGDLWVEAGAAYIRVGGASYDLTAAAGATLAGLTDTDLTAAADHDMLFNNAGTWEDTGGLLLWNESTLIANLNLSTDSAGLRANNASTTGAARVSAFNSANADEISIRSNGSSHVGTAMGIGRASKTELWSDAGMLIYNIASADMVLGTNDTVALTVDGLTQNITIAQDLDVTGQITIGGGTPQANVEFYALRTSGPVYSKLETGGASAVGWRAENSANEWAFAVDSSGHAIIWEVGTAIPVVITSGAPNSSLVMDSSGSVALSQTLSVDGTITSDSNFYRDQNGAATVGLLRVRDTSTGSANVGQLAATLPGAGAASSWIFQSSIGTITFGNTGSVVFSNTGVVAITPSASQAIFNLNGNTATAVIRAGGTNAIEMNETTQDVTILQDLAVDGDTTMRGNLELSDTGNVVRTIDLDTNRSATDDIIGLVRARWNGNDVCRIDFRAGSDTANKDNGYLVIYTSETGTLVERLRIREDGLIVAPLPTSDPGVTNALWNSSGVVNIS